MQDGLIYDFILKKKKLEVTTVNGIALAEHKHSGVWFLSEIIYYITMIIICCNITKYDTEIILLYSVSPFSLFFFFSPQSDLILVRESQLLFPTVVANN